MSWTYQNSTLGFTVPVEIPFDDVTEYDNQVGEQGAHLLQLAAQECYSWNGKFRSGLADRIEQETGIKRPVKEVKKVGDKEVTVYMLEAPYLNMVKNHENAPSEESLNKWAQEVAAACGPLKLTPSERGKLAKNYLDIGQAYVNKINAGSGTFEGFKSKWEEANGVSFVSRFGAGEMTAELIGRAVKANEDRKTKLAAQQTELLDA